MIHILGSRRVLFGALFFGALALLAGGLAREMTTSELQAEFFSGIGRNLGYRLGPGTNPAPIHPPSGPYDVRLGYARLPGFLSRLEASGYRIEQQARPSPRLQSLAEWGLFPVYSEKSQAGIEVYDRENRLLYEARYPQRVYERFEAVPPLVVSCLIEIENRGLLDFTHPRRNPAVDWGRLAKAIGVHALGLIDRRRRAIGGSTLATQIEKFRHSPEGRTLSARDKLKQMVSASFRAYLGGPDTIAARRRIVLDYVNSVPLAAVPGRGEILGLGDGLWAWYGRDFAEVNRLLLSPGESHDRALAFKQVLSLILAQRRPSYYLTEDRKALETLTNGYLGFLANRGVISPGLRAAALRAKLRAQGPGAVVALSAADRKGVNQLRTRLAGQIGLPALYDLDRLDLRVRSTLDAPAQEAVTRALKDLRDPDRVQAAGLREFHLLGRGDPSRVVYAFTFYERTAGANLLRIQADNLDQPLDVNEGSKLDLGSTAKLRTLVTYLEIIASLHEKYASLPSSKLRALGTEPHDRLTAWAIDYLLGTETRKLSPMLEAALDRKYAASPAERFFTGGGVHTFHNFEPEHNSRIFSVREGLQRSVNLVFIRLMRDIVRYYEVRVPGAKILGDPTDPQRQVYLERFADREGSDFIRRFYRKHRGETPGEALDSVLSGIRPTPVRLATVLRSVDPSAGTAALKALIDRYLPGATPSDDEVSELWEKYSPDKFSLVDRGYIAHVHPLELWLLDYLRRHPQASLADVLAASAGERQEVYGWLFKTRHKHAQDRRISTLIEIEAFLEIHAAWQRLGYPFPTLVPSLATAIGSSADRPASLAELIGILANGGVRLPVVRIEELHFAAQTPYETVVAPYPAKGERLLSQEIAEAARGALINVVEKGTAERLRKALRGSNGASWVAGGKTGTGDLRYDRFGRGGRLLESRVVARAATFVFFLGDRFFGTVTAYVPGPEAALYGFTSALPVQVLALLMPTLSTVIGEPEPQVPEKKALREK